MTEPEHTLDTGPMLWSLDLKHQLKWLLNYNQTHTAGLVFLAGFLYNPSLISPL